MQWQPALLEQIRRALPPGGAVRPYGSVLAPDTLDRWSDLDVEVDLPVAVPAEALVDGVPWAWQDDTADGLQRLRLVLRDGRRVDAAVRGGPALLPEPPTDNGARFDLALAAVRFGRGADLIGLHLALGVVREALELGMLLADRRTGTVHHRARTEADAAAAQALDALAGELGPGLTLRVADFAAERRAAVDDHYRADWSGLVAIVTEPTGVRDEDGPARPSRGPAPRD
jgi:hypothetical protein